MRDISSRCGHLRENCFVLRKSIKLLLQYQANWTNVTFAKYRVRLLFEVYFCIFMCLCKNKMLLSIQQPQIITERKYL